MAEILRMFRVKTDVMLAQILLILILAVYSSQGGCTFPESWAGKWFLSGLPPVAINSTHIQYKGECAETDSKEKFMLYDRSDDGCYRCMVIHEKHKNVLQYKETFCGAKESLSSMCETINGDAPLLSMFRKEPQPLSEPCPFHPAPFTFSYSRGVSECSNPPSRAESCTDDSRLLLRYMACPDMISTESFVEELVCLATWKEGSTRYLVGQINQLYRKNSMLDSDEDTFRCFIYKGQHINKSSTYEIAQSGDATCNGLSSASDGSRIIKLTNSDDEHNRCHFPNWVVKHHKWFSLDHTHQYHFTTKNATLKIMNEDGSFEEKRLVCHSILEQRDNQYMTLVAHETKGCESGHRCVKIIRRDTGLLEIQYGSDTLWESAQHACFEPMHTKITLISAALNPTQCPMVGRYSVAALVPEARPRRQQINIDETQVELDQAVPTCENDVYDSAEVGCGNNMDSIQFHSPCTTTEYTCYGSWSEGNTGYIVAAPASPSSAHHRHTLCFIYTQHDNNSSSSPGQLTVSVMAGGCTHRQPDASYNLTNNGTCEQSSKLSVAHRLAPAAIFILPLAFSFLR